MHYSVILTAKNFTSIYNNNNNNNNNDSNENAKISLTLKIIIKIL